MFYIKCGLNFKCLTPTKGSVHSNSVIIGVKGDFEQKFTRDSNRGLQWAEDSICLTYDISLLPKL